MASEAYTAMKTSIQLGLQNLWTQQSAKATQDGEESKDPSETINKMADDLAKVIADAVETYISAGQIIISGANITGSNGGGPVVFTPADPANMTFI